MKERVDGPSMDRQGKTLRHRDADDHAAHHIIFLELGIIITTVGVIVMTRPARFGDRAVGIGRDKVLFAAKLLFPIKIFARMFGDILQCFDFEVALGLILIVSKATYCAERR